MCEGQEYETLLKEVNEKVEELQVNTNLSYFCLIVLIYIYFYIM